MKLRTLAWIAGLSCAVAAPAYAARSHGGGRPDRVPVLLAPPAPPSLPSVVDLPAWVTDRAAGKIEKKAAKWDAAKFDRWLSRWLARHQPKPRPPRGGNGGGPVVVPPGAPPSAMPEPSAALLFPLGTGLVALVLRRRSRLSP